MGTLAIFFACSQYDDAWIKDEFTDIENRLNELEKKCEKLNGEISSIQNILKAIQENDFVTDIKNIESAGRVIGYEIHFSKNQAITLYHGADGVDGVSYFKDVTHDSEYVYITLNDGTTLKMQKVSTLELSLEIYTAIPGPFTIIAAMTGHL